jgi:hypothetical protein
VDIKAPPPGERGSNTSRLAGATTNKDILGTQQDRRHKLVHRDAADAATKDITQDAHIQIVGKTGGRSNKKQHAVGCEYVHRDMISGQITVERTAGVGRELRKEFITPHNGKPPWSIKAFVRTLSEIEHHDVVSSGIFADEFPYKRPHE